MIRYIWNFESRNLYPTPILKGERIPLPNVRRGQTVFVNILEVHKREADDLDCYKVKLFYPDGNVFEGWVWSGCCPIDITNKDELFDGRFNQ